MKAIFILFVIWLIGKVIIDWVMIRNLEKMIKIYKRKCEVLNEIIELKK